MTRTELLGKICPTHNTNDCCTGENSFHCDDCDKLMESWFDEYDKQIRADAIEELGKAICDELDKGYIFINKHQI